MSKSDEKPAKKRLLELLWDQEWHPWEELRGVAGQRYGARLHELRQVGFTVETRDRKGDDRGRDYRLSSREPSDPKKKRVRVYLDVEDARILAIGGSTKDARNAIKESLDSYFDN